MSTNAITFRPGTLEDTYANFLVLEAAISDLLPRLGIQEATSFADPDALAKMWERRRPLFEHLTHTAEHFWVAEQEGKIVGYARSTFHDGVRELTEFFVRPEVQSAGVGRGLFERAFPREGARRRSIIATTDLRAQARYLKSGVYPRFPIMYFEKQPESVSFTTDLAFQPVTATSGALDKLDWLDEQVLEYRRRADHEFLLGHGQGWVYLRAGKPVGYGYTGKNNGPFALLDPADFPAILAHAEHQTFAEGREKIGMEVPLHNRHAVDYLLSRGYKIPDGFFAFFMSDEPFGKFEQYIVTSPPFFV